MFPQPDGVIHGEPGLLITPAVPGLEALPVLGILDALLYLALLLHVLGLVLGQQDPALKTQSLGKVHSENSFKDFAALSLRTLFSGGESFCLSVLSSGL